MCGGEECGWMKDVVNHCLEFEGRSETKYIYTWLLLVTALRLGHELNITEIKTEFSSSSSFDRFCGFSGESYIWRKNAPGMIYCSSSDAVENLFGNVASL